MVAAYRFKPVITLLLLALLLVAVLLSLALGPVAIPLGDTLRVLLLMLQRKMIQVHW